ncbi:MAG: DNA topoisomerase I [Nitrososphaeria archaeon]
MNEKTDIKNYTLVICEKADAAKRIAEALGDNVKVIEKKGIKIYYISNSDGKKYVICSALGHLYGLGNHRKDRKVYPVFDLMWLPLNYIDKNKGSVFDRIKIIEELAKNASEFVNACDYDVEGSTIGFNILRYACKVNSSKTLRAKFSTLTKEELAYAFKNLKGQIDRGLVKAGITRHIVDYLWGINLSRILISSLQQVPYGGGVLSTGRVQGPTLKFIVDREIEIRSFVTKPYWITRAIVAYNGIETYASYFKEKIMRRKEALAIKEENEGETGIVKEVKRIKVELKPPTPFNTGDLQKEAYRIFRFSPSLTLNIAEQLYLQALISYPRTNSQRLPKTINYHKIIKGLSYIKEYKEETGILLSKKLVPHEGEKDDPAHPCIYPTGEIEGIEKLNDRQKKLFDLIVRRFFAIFAENAVMERNQILIDVKGKHYWKINGRQYIQLGWINFYRKYFEAEEIEIPPFKEGDKVLLKMINVEEKFEKRPPRFNKGSLLEKMEEENLGTKATRAEIIDTLYKRRYIVGESIIPTELGFQVIETLSKYSGKIISIDLTREMEESLEKIELEQEEPEDVLERTFYFAWQAINDLSDNLEKIGFELKNAMQITALENKTLGICPICKEGLLVVINNKKTNKRFVGCTNYKKGCNFVAPLPQKGVIQNTGKTCTTCGWPIVQIRNSKSLWSLCINFECPSKVKNKNGRKNL